MNLSVNLDFENTYDIEDISEDLTKFKFNTITKDGESIELHVSIANNRNVFLPSVYNLAFGPLNAQNEIDDTIRIKHADNSKVYSTILLGAITFLNNNGNKEAFVGIDGSDIARAYLYYKLLKTNYDYLRQFLNSIGVKYYVRLLRGNTINDPLLPDNEDLATQPFLIDKEHNTNCKKLYNYFMFRLTK